MKLLELLPYISNWDEISIELTQKEDSEDYIERYEGFVENIPYKLVCCYVNKNSMCVADGVLVLSVRIKETV